jgi:hypothetical protein
MELMRIIRNVLIYQTLLRESVEFGDRLSGVASREATLNLRTGRRRHAIIGTFFP